MSFIFLCILLYFHVFLYLDRLHSFILDLVFIYIIDNTKNNKGKHFKYFVERRKLFIKGNFTYIIYIIHSVEYEHFSADSHCNACEQKII